MACARGGQRYLPTVPWRKGPPRQMPGRGLSEMLSSRDLEGYGQLTAQHLDVAARHARRQHHVVHPALTVKQPEVDVLGQCLGDADSPDLVSVLVLGRLRQVAHLAAKAEPVEVIPVDSDSAPWLNLWDNDQIIRASLLVSRRGSPALTLMDKHGKARVGIALLSDGSPGLGLLDKDGKVLWKAPPY